MRNNIRTRIIAWIMIVMLMVCGLAVNAMAEEGMASDSTPRVTLADGPAVVNNVCTVTTKYKDADRNVIDVSGLKAGDACILYIKAEELSKLPDQGVFYYNLPVEVGAVMEDKTDGAVKWVYLADTQQLAFSWVDGKPDEDQFTVNVPVTVGGVYPLYNMARLLINNQEVWYRLDKTTIKTDKPYSAYPNESEIKDNYEAAAYDFTTTTITVDGTEYVYLDMNHLDEYLEDPKPYYTATLMRVKTTNILTKPKNNVLTIRWMLPEGVAEYTEDNKTGGYHRDYDITLHGAIEEQPLFNFLKGKDNKYYRLKKTKIIAAPFKSYKSGTRMDNEFYIINDGGYDFTNLVLTFDNKEYRYSEDRITTGKYDNYYTIKKSDFLAKDKMHGDASWYKNEAGWLDGAKETFTEAELKNNNTWGYHQDYIATFYNGNATFYNVEMHNGDEVTKIRSIKDGIVDMSETPVKAGAEFIGWNTAEDGSGENYNAENPLTLKGNIVLYAQFSAVNEAENGLSVSIVSSWPEDKPAYAGTKITLTAVLNGFDNKDFTLQWQYSTDQKKWTDVDGETGMTMTFKLDEHTATYFWRVVARNVKNK